MTIIEASNLNGLSKDSSADAFQTKSVSVDRFTEKLGDVTPEQLNKIHIAITKTLNSAYTIY